DDVQGVALYHTSAGNYGTIELCYQLTCIATPFDTSVHRWGNRFYVDKSELGISGSQAVELTIRHGGNGTFIGLEGIHILPSDPQNTNLQLIPNDMPVSPTSNLIRRVDPWVTSVVA